MINRVVRLISDNPLNALLPLAGVAITLDLIGSSPLVILILSASR